MAVARITPFDAGQFTRATGLAFGGAAETAGRAVGDAIALINSPEYKLAEEKLKAIQQGKIDKKGAIEYYVEERVRDVEHQQKIYGTRDKMVPDEISPEGLAAFEQGTSPTNAPVLDPEAAAPRAEPETVPLEKGVQGPEQVKFERTKAFTPKRKPKKVTEQLSPERTSKRISQEAFTLKKGLRKKLERLSPEEIKDYGPEYAKWKDRVMRHKQQYGNVRTFAEPDPQALVQREGDKLVFFEKFNQELTDFETNQRQQTAKQLTQEFEKTPEIMKLRESGELPTYKEHFRPWALEKYGDVSKMIDKDGNPVDDDPNHGIANGKAMTTLADPEMIELIQGELDTVDAAAKRKVEAEAEQRLQDQAKSTETDKEAKREETKEERANRKEFRAEIRNLKKDGTLTIDEAKNAAILTGFADTKEFKDFMDSNFPQERRGPNATGQKLKNNKEVAENKIPLLEEQIGKVNAELNEIKNAELGREIKVTDPITGDTRFEKVTNDEKRQQLLASPTKELRKLERALIDAKATVGGKAAQPAPKEEAPAAPGGDPELNNLLKAAKELGLDLSDIGQ